MVFLLSGVFAGEIEDALNSGKWTVVIGLVDKKTTASRTPLERYARVVARWQVANESPNAPDQRRIYADSQTELSALIEADPRFRDAALALARLGRDMADAAPAEIAVNHFPADVAVLRLAGMAAVTQAVTGLQDLPPGYDFLIKDKEGFERRRQQVRVRAAEWLTQAEALGGGTAESARWLGRLALDRGAWEDASRWLSLASDRAPQPWFVRLEHAEAAIMRLRSAQAEQDMAYVRETLGDSPQRAAAERTLARAFSRSAYFSQAVDSFSKALELDPSIRGLRAELARAAFADAQFELALWAYGQSHKVDGGQPEDLLGFAMCLSHLGEAKRAQQHLDAYFKQLKPGSDGKVPPPSRNALHYRGRLAWLAGDVKAALPDLKAAFDASPENSAYAAWCHRAQLATDDLHGAIATARAHGLAGGREDNETAAASLQAILNRWPLPRVEDFTARRSPHLAAAHEALAQLAGKRGDWGNAAWHWPEALMVRGAGARLSAGLALMHAGANTEAAQCFTDLLERTQDASARDWCRAGLALLALRQGDGAKAAAWTAKIEDVKTIGDYNHASMNLAASRLGGPAFDGGGDQVARLGVFLLPKSTGAEVLAVLPGSPLESLQLQPASGDFIVSIDGQELRTSAMIRAFAGHLLPDSCLIRMRDGDDESAEWLKTESWRVTSSTTPGGSR